MTDAKKRFAALADELFAPPVSKDEKRRKRRARASVLDWNGYVDISAFQRAVAPPPSAPPPPMTVIRVTGLRPGQEKREKCDACHGIGYFRTAEYPPIPRPMDKSAKFSTKDVPCTTCNGYREVIYIGVARDDPMRMAEFREWYE